MTCDDINVVMSLKSSSDMYDVKGAQWLSRRVLDWRLRGRGLEPHRHHCVVSLNKNINPSLVLVQPRKTYPFITERLLMGCKESNENKQMYDVNVVRSLKSSSDVIALVCSGH